MGGITLPNNGFVFKVPQSLGVSAINLTDDISAATYIFGSSNGYDYWHIDVDNLLVFDAPPAFILLDVSGVPIADLSAIVYVMRIDSNAKLTDNTWVYSNGRYYFDYYTPGSTDKWFYIEIL